MAMKGIENMLYTVLTAKLVDQKSEKKIQLKMYINIAAVGSIKINNY